MTDFEGLVSPPHTKQTLTNEELFNENHIFLTSTVKTTTTNAHMTSI